MTTYLVALHFSRDVEADLVRFAKRVFGESCTFPLPPLVPLYWVDCRPADHYLDRVRKRNPTTVSFLPLTARVYGHFVWIDPVFKGSEELANSVASQLPRGNPLFPAAMSVLLSTIPEVEKTDDHTVFQVSDNWRATTTTRSTAALWLSLVQITVHGKEWWDAMSWQMWYSRRITNQQ